MEHTELLGRVVRDKETGMVGRIAGSWDDGRTWVIVVWDQSACVLGEDVELVEPGEVV